MDYDICLSFAGENREYVEQVAEMLVKHDIRVFYDRYETSTLWGKDLYQHLDFVYRKCARFCVIFISEAYGKKLWTKHELRSAQARAFEENREYLLPTRFDDTEIPGLPSTIGYTDLRHTTPAVLSEFIREKINKNKDAQSIKPEILHVKSTPTVEKPGIKRVNLVRATIIRSKLNKQR